MSPLSLRRYRAERLLRDEFEALRGTVLAGVRGRLRASGVGIDASDLEACYGQAWQGLYAAVLDGQEITNPAGWLALVTFRRAIEEHRAHRRLADADVAGAEDRDFAAELDDRTTLRQLFEALRGRLSARERQAAALCYLQGLSRSDAAARMGVSEARMRKLMEGHGAGRPGVAGKVGTLVETIRAGGWCAEQGSLMRGLAYGILDPDGERYQLALIHSSECPGCRAYVASPRGLAAALPPVPVLLQWALGTGAAAGTGAGAGAGVGAHAGGAEAAAGGLAPAGPGLGGSLPASGAAGASAAGGGWLLAGSSVGAKLAVGCLLALGVGAGCVALTDHPSGARAPVHRRASARVAATRVSALLNPAAGELAVAGRLGAVTPSRNASSATASSVPSSPARRASREFGPEQALAPGASGSVAPRARTAANVASAAQERPVGRGLAERQSSASPGPTGSARRSAGTPAAQREFAPG